MDESNLDVFGIVGTMVGGAYQVQSVVAEGGFAVVYRAQHTGFSAPVALKCLKLPQKLDAERQAAFLRQFRAEGELLFQLSSGIPAVVRPLHVDALTTPDGTFVPYIVLEWLEGETLDAHVRQRRGDGRPLTLKKLVRLLTPVARALERAHNFRGPRGIVSVVHRDIKPENIFVAEVAGEEVVKILDFGVASAQSTASQVAGHTGGGAAAGSLTPAYAAPEQWLPKRYGQTGPWTDVFGLALTLVEALKGSPVLTGDVQSMMSAALDKQKRPTPREHGIDVPDAVEGVFQRALALDPRERPADVGVFWDELCAALGLKLEDRHRDRRTEAGMVPREERIEAAAARASGAPRGALALDGAADTSSARLRVAARVDPDSSSGLRVVPPPELESSTRLAAKPVDPDSSSRMPIARVALVSRGAPLRREEPPSAPPAPRLDLGLPTDPRPEACRDRLEIDLQTAPSCDEPRRIQTGPRRPYVPPAAPTAAEPSLWPRLALGAGLILAAIAVTLVDRALADSGGIPLGPVSPVLLGGLLVVAGLAIIVHRLVTADRP